jgi:hypothetical protein
MLSLGSGVGVVALALSLCDARAPLTELSSEAVRVKLSDLLYPTFWLPLALYEPLP